VRTAQAIYAIGAGAVTIALDRQVVTAIGAA
jgi:hypothetical protein